MNEVQFEATQSQPQKSFTKDDFRVQIYTSFAAAETVWRRYERESYFYLFQGYDWLEQWYLHGVSEQEKRTLKLCFVDLRDAADQLLLFCPFGVSQKFHITSLVWLGNGFTDYNAPLINKHLEPATFFKLNPDWWPAILQSLPPIDRLDLDRQSAWIEEQKVPNPFYEITPTAAIYKSFCVELNQTWEHYFQTQLPEALRADIVRKQRRLERLGALVFEIAEDEKEIVAITEAMIEQKTRRYQETEALNIFADPQVQEFYLKSVPILQKKGLLHVSSLKSQGEIIATHWGLCQTGRFYYLMLTFADGQWRKNSPGKILIQFLVQWAYQHKIAVFDFTIGEEPYKLEWTNIMMPLNRWQAALSWKGQAHHLLQVCKAKIKQHPRIFSALKRLRAFNK